MEKKKSQPTHYLLRKAKGLVRPLTVLAEQIGTLRRPILWNCWESDAVKVYKDSDKEFFPNNAVEYFVSKIVTVRIYFL